MSLINAGQLVRDAFSKGYAVPAINTQGGNYDLVRAIVEAAEEERAPIILQAYEANTAYYGLGWLPFLAGFLSQYYDIPIAVHLDHGSSLQTVLQAIELGYTSVMIDYSRHPIEENIAVTNQVLAVARRRNVSVEAEIGIVQKGDENSGQEYLESLVDPEDVRRFLAEAPVDMLAVGIGNAHGFYRGEPRIRLDLLSRVQEISGNTPLVLHGTTGIPDAVVQKCIQHGMAKINYGTLFRSKMMEYCKEDFCGTFDHKDQVWRVCEQVHSRLKQDIRSVLKLLGSAGRA